METIRYLSEQIGDTEVSRSLSRDARKLSISESVGFALTYAILDSAQRSSVQVNLWAIVVIAKMDFSRAIFDTLYSVSIALDRTRTKINVKKNRRMGLYIPFGRIFTSLDVDYRVP